MRILFATILAVLLTNHEARAEFAPESVGVVYNSAASDGQKVAEYYAQKRGIPKENIFALKTSADEYIERAAYEKEIVAPLRQKLESQKLHDKIRVLVTTRGMPLKIKPAERTASEKEQLVALTSSQTQARDSLRRMVQSASSFAVDKPEPVDTAALAKLSDEDLLRRTNETLHAAGKRLEESAAASRTSTLNVKFSNFVSQFGGLAALAKLLKPMPNADQAKSNEKIESIKKQVQSAQRILSLLDEIPDAENQKRALQLTMKLYGLAGVMQRASALKGRFESPNTDASLESELSLLWWDADMYPLAERVANPWFHRVLQNGAPSAPISVLMVSRLDAPQTSQVLKAIDGMLIAEKDGLNGKAYFDARGLKDGQQSYLDYDDSIKKTADLFREHTKYEVVLDTEDRTFSKPNEAANAAVYVGWYKLRHYEDAFTFPAGALGFHVASEEAVSIQKSAETGWCRNALAHGIAVTMGAVGEPMLDSFPKAHEFFGILLTGNYSLIEAYYLTTPYLSWRMTVFGDPLYNPWRGKNFVTGKDIAGLQPDSRDLQDLPVAPSKQAFADPLAARQALLEKRARLKSELDQFYVQVEEKAKAVRDSMPKK